MSEKGSKTAAELMAELEGDESWVARRDARDRTHRERIAQNRADAAPILEAVAAAAGVEVASLVELRERSGPEVVRVLLDWLPRVENLDVKQDLVGALAVSWARPAAAAPLIAEFEAISEGGEGDGLRWSIADALASVVDSSVVEDLIRLVRDRSSRKARQMLAVALGNVDDGSAVPVLVELLDDEEVAGHAVIGLVALGAVEARPAIERLRYDRREWVRDEVRRALAEL